MNADGGPVAQLTHKFGDNYPATRSPEGGKIVFSHDKLREKSPQIYAMTPEMTGITRVTHTNDDSFLPDWGSG